MRRFRSFCTLAIAGIVAFGAGSCLIGAMEGPVSAGLAQPQGTGAGAANLPGVAPARSDGKDIKPLDEAFNKVEPVPGEKEIERLVRDLGSGDFATRERVNARLHAFGPQIVPALQKYVNDDDAEIAGRIANLIKGFEWAKRGAVVFGTEESTPARMLGVRPGDVIAKVNDTPVRDRQGVAAIEPSQARTLWILRDGKAVSIRVPAGSIGVRLGDWDLAKGGLEQVRALSRLERPDTDTVQMCRELAAARKAGMTDRWCTGLLASLAAQCLDHAYAMQCYRVFRGDDSTCSLTHDDTAFFLHRLPFESPHSAFLLERYRSDQWSPMLYHELEDWFLRHGRNYPMLKQVLGKRWDPTGATNDYRRYDAEARVVTDVVERRWDDAVRDFENGPESYLESDRRYDCAIYAAICSGRIEKAVSIAEEMWGLCKENPTLSKNLVAEFWYVIEAAAIVGDEPSIRRMTALIYGMDLNTRFIMASQWTHFISKESAAARYTLPILASIARLPQAINVRNTYFFLLGFAPDTTREVFEKAWNERVQPPANGVNQNPFAVIGFLRFGLHEKALATWQELYAAQPGAFRPEDNEAVLRTIDFVSKHAKRFETDWSAMKGLIQVIPDPDGKAYWCLRWDGAIFFVDDQGTMHEYPGLTKFARPPFVSGRYLFVGATQVVRVEPNYDSAIDGWITPHQWFIFDRAHQKWVDPAKSETEFSDDPTIPGLAGSIALSAICRYAEKQYPLPAGEMPRGISEVASGDIALEGNLRIQYNLRDHSINDLSAKVAAAAELNRPAEVYEVQPDPDRGGIMIFSDAGLFEQAGGVIKRIELPGIKNQNVHTTLLNAAPGYQRMSYNGILVGVAPQDGGQVFIIKRDGIRLTRGYCGLGPNDWFARQLNRNYRSTMPTSAAIRHLRMKLEDAQARQR